MNPDQVRALIKKRRAAKAKANKTTATVVRQAPLKARGNVGLDMNELKAMLEKSKEGDFGNTTKLKTGKNRFIITMNRGTNRQRWYEERIKFWIPGAAKNGNARPIVSARSFDPNAYCPAFEAYEKLKAEGDETVTKQFGPRTTYISNAFMQQPDGSWEYAVLEYGKMVLRDLGEHISAEVNDEHLDENGIVVKVPIVSKVDLRIIQVTKQGTGFETRYPLAVTGNRMTAMTKELWEQRQDLSKVELATPTQTTAELVGRYLSVNGVNFKFGNGNAAAQSSGPNLLDNIADSEDEDSWNDQDRSDGADTVSEDTFLDNEDDIPDPPSCLGSFGSPIKSLECETCYYNETCADTSEVTDDDDEDDD